MRAPRKEHLSTMPIRHEPDVVDRLLCTSFVAKTAADKDEDPVLYIQALRSALDDAATEIAAARRPGASDD